MSLASRKLLEITSASTNNGVVLQIWHANNNNCQKWTVTPAGDGTLKLLNVNSDSTADGARVIQWPYGGGSNQQWLISDVP